MTHSLIESGVNFLYNPNNFEISDEENETYDIDMVITSNKQNAPIKQNENADDNGIKQKVFYEIFSQYSALYAR